MVHAVADNPLDDIVLEPVWWPKSVLFNVKRMQEGSEAIKVLSCCLVEAPILAGELGLEEAFDGVCNT
jgi:hypothetical protein